MNIGIIGAGNIGGTLARRLAKLGHRVSIANSRGPESLRALERESGAKAVSVNEAVEGKDVIVVTIPEGKIQDLPKELFGKAASATVVIDTGNYYPNRDSRIAAIETGTPESLWVAQQIGHAVVKAFNNIYAQHLMENGRPAGAPGRIALPVAGDDARAKQVVLLLVEQLGFDGVDAGTLADSWRQQPGTPVYTADLDAAGVKQALGRASKERPKTFRAT